MIAPIMTLRAHEFARWKSAMRKALANVQSLRFAGNCKEASQALVKEWNRMFPHTVCRNTVCEGRVFGPRLEATHVVALLGHPQRQRCWWLVDATWNENAVEWDGKQVPMDNETMEGTDVWVQLLASRCPFERASRVRAKLPGALYFQADC